MRLDESSTARSTRGLSGSIKSNMNFDYPSLPSYMIPIVGSVPDCHPDGSVTVRPGSTAMHSVISLAASRVV
jgi:hypothetical protein